MLFGTVFLLYLTSASAYVLPLMRYPGRIVGGEETTIDDRPFSASLQYGVSGMYMHSCGASILSELYFLSAAHCKPGSLDAFMRVGSTQAVTGGQVVSILWFKQHPLYSRNILDYDVAVIRVANAIQFGTNVVPTKLPTSADPGEGAMVTVSGWGVTDEFEGDTSDVLRKVDLPVWSNDRCRGVYSFLTPRQICLGGTAQGGTSACFGDSGGPVTYNGVQIATVSGGNSCSAPNIPGIYARMSVVLDWIKDEAEL